MYCKKCGASIPDDAGKCPDCGAAQAETKFCQHCGASIDKDCVVCPKCGKQVEKLQTGQPNVIVNNSNSNTNRVGGYGAPKNKWVAFALCLLFGYFGAHKFYEGKAGMGVLYLFTCGLCGIGWMIDIVLILLKPTEYYV